jgi:hypothetical protein
MKSAAMGLNIFRSNLLRLRNTILFAADKCFLHFMRGIFQAQSLFQKEFNKFSCFIPEIPNDYILSPKSYSSPAAGCCLM